MSHFLAPSILSADFGHLADAIHLINESEADWFHVDVMDGVFVPNISFGFPVMEALRSAATKPLDVHLMITAPERYIDAFAEGGASVLTVHAEACTHLHRTVQAIKQAGMQAGVALNPHTPVFTLENVIADLDVVLLMSVNPGFGGQRFIPQTFAKIAQVRELIADSNSRAIVEVDGGVNLDNYLELVKAGADVLVAGNAVFAHASPAEAIKRLKGLS